MKAFGMAPILGGASIEGKLAAARFVYDGGYVFFQISVPL